MSYKARIQLDGVTTETEMLEAVADALNFPDYFGKNLDALWDLMTNLSWIKEKDIDIEMYGFTDLMKIIDPERSVRFLFIMAETCRYWDEVNGDVDPLTDEVKHRITFTIYFPNGSHHAMGGDIWPEYGDGWTGPEVWGDRRWR